MLRQWSNASCSGSSTTAAAEAEAQKLLELVEQAGPFRDGSFPASSSSLGRRHTNVTIRITENRRTTDKIIPIEWIRPQHIRDSEGEFGADFAVL